MDHHIIFSPSRGYWSRDRGWVSSPVIADCFSREESDYYLMPEGTVDAKFVHCEKHAHMRRDQIMDAMKVVFDEKPGEEIAEFFSTTMGYELEYEGDGLWVAVDVGIFFRKGKLLSIQDIHMLLDMMLNILMPSAIADAYYSLTGDYLYPDGNFGFYIIRNN